MAEYLSEARLQEFAELFSTLDFYSNGTISIESFHEILKSMSLRISLEEARELVKETCPNNSSCDTVLLTEFLTIVSIVVEDKDMNREIFEIFEIFDIDKNKIIDRHDFEVGFRQLETNLSEEDILKLLESSGRNSFNIREFRKYLLDR